MTNYREQWANGEIEAGTLLDEIDDLRDRLSNRALDQMVQLGELITTEMKCDKLHKTLKDLKWRIQDTSDQLQSYGMKGERLYGLDEWSVPIRNLGMAVSVIEELLEV